jgi:hypothetical protein
MSHCKGVSTEKTLRSAGLEPAQLRETDFDSGNNLTKTNEDERLNPRGTLNSILLW